MLTVDTAAAVGSRLRPRSTTGMASIGTRRTSWIAGGRQYHPGAGLPWGCPACRSAQQYGPHAVALVYRCRASITAHEFHAESCRGCGRGSCPPPSSTDTFQCLAYLIAGQPRKLCFRNGNDYLAALLQLHGCCGNLDLETSVCCTYLQRLTSFQTKCFSQRLWHDDPPGGIDGGFHGPENGMEMVWKWYGRNHRPRRYGRGAGWRMRMPLAGARLLPEGG